MNSLARTWCLLLACGLTACATLPPVAARDVDPGPAARVSGVPVEQGHALFEGKGGIQLYQQWWRPVGTPPKAVVVVIHGLKDHSSRYGELAGRLVAHGFAVHAMDLRGHARSEGARVDVGSFDDYVEDLTAFIQRVKAREPGKPVFLFGHSMGGAVVALYTLAHPEQLAGLITHGAALKLDVGGVKATSIKFLSAIDPHGGFFQLDLNDFSRDPEVVRAAKEDPFIYQPPAPVHTATELLAATHRIQQHMEEFTLPLLILHGSEDKLTAHEGSEELYLRAKSTDKTLKIYPGLYHDLVHEPEKEQVFNDILRWLDAHAPAAAPGAT